MRGPPHLITRVDETFTIFIIRFRDIRVFTLYIIVGSDSSQYGRLHQMPHPAGLLTYAVPSMEHDRVSAPFIFWAYMGLSVKLPGEVFRYWEHRS